MKSVKFPSITEIVNRVFILRRRLLSYNDKYKSEKNSIENLLFSKKTMAGKLLKMKLR